MGQGGKLGQIEPLPLFSRINIALSDSLEIAKFVG